MISCQEKSYYIYLINRFNCYRIERCRYFYKGYILVYDYDANLCKYINS